MVCVKSFYSVNDISVFEYILDRGLLLIILPRKTYFINLDPNYLKMFCNVIYSKEHFFCDLKSSDDLDILIINANLYKIFWPFLQD